jgi:hypothetical protein
MFRWGGLAGLVLTLALVAPAHAAKVNKHPGFIQVYDSNIENLETPTEFCKGDWQDLVYYMKVQPLSPDLLILQQISGRAQLNRLLAFMNKNLPGRFKGVIARSDPRPFNSPCHAAKAKQTNAIIYRKGRFSFRSDSKRTFRSKRRTAKGCVDESLDRSENVLVHLVDKTNGRTVVVGSIHWPTGHRQGPACANRNARQIAKRLAAADQASLRFFGGDANTTPGEWTQRLTGKFGYTDSAAQACGGDAGCMGQQWTIGHSRRIDFLFGRNETTGTPASFTQFRTISFEAGNAAARRVTGGDDPASYSDHRALAARIHY